MGHGVLRGPEDRAHDAGKWCATWLGGYATRRPSTVRQAEVHVCQIIAAFEGQPLASVRPSQVKAWTAKHKAEALSTSYVYALHARCHRRDEATRSTTASWPAIRARDARCPARASSARTSQRPRRSGRYTTRSGSTLLPQSCLVRSSVCGRPRRAERGSPTSTSCGGRLTVGPVPGEPLTTETSRTAVPIPADLAMELSAEVARWGGDTIVTDGIGGRRPGGASSA